MWWESRAAQAALAPGPSEAKRAQRQKALTRFAMLVGAMVVARAMKDDVISEEILNACRADLLELA